MRQKIILLSLIAQSLLLNNISAQSWLPIDSGISDFGHSLYFDEIDDAIYISTYYDWVVGNTPPGALKWDGSVLSVLKDIPIGATATSILRYEDNVIYAGAGNGLTRAISAWNGDAWDDMPKGSNTLIGIGGVGAMNIYKNELIVMGLFSINNFQWSIAKYNGVGWSDFADSTYFNGEANRCMQIDGSFVIIGKNIALDTTFYSNAVEWDGANFNDISIAQEPCRLFAMDVYRDTLYVGSACGNLYKRNDTIWEKVLSADSSINIIKTYQDKLLIGGGYKSIDGIKANGISMLKNSNIEVFDQGVDGIVFGIEVYHGRPIITGDFDSANGKIVNNLALWDQEIGIIAAKSVNSSFLIFPNPSNGKFQISSESDESIQVEFYNTSGQLIWSTAASPNKEIEIPSFIHSELYLLKVHQGELWQSTKLVLNR